MTVPTAMDCAASSIHHSPLSQMLPLGSDTASKSASPNHAMSDANPRSTSGASRCNVLQ